MKNKSILLLCLLVWGACKKDKIPFPVEEISSPISYHLETVKMISRDTGYIMGGRVYEYGGKLLTTDGGKTWSADSMSNKIVYSVDFWNSQQGVACGLDGNIYRTSNRIDWTFAHTGIWQIWKDIDYFDAGHGIAVGGQSYGSGQIYTFQPNWTNNKFDTTKFELNAVCFSSLTTAHIAGYGAVLRSTDSGLTWQPNEIDGDNFRDVDFPTPTIGYIVGWAGTILKTVDEGKTWQRLRNGNRPFVGGHFKAVKFVSETKGYIVGDNGLFWRTVNGGDSWEASKIADVDFNAIDVYQGIGIIAADDGRIFRFED